MPHYIPSGYAQDETKLLHSIYWCIFRSAVYFFDAHRFFLINESTSKKAHQRIKWMCDVFNINKWEQLNKWATDIFHCGFLMEPKYCGTKLFATKQIMIVIVQNELSIAFFHCFESWLENRIQVNSFKLHKIYLKIIQCCLCTNRLVYIKIKFKDWF